MLPLLRQTARLLCAGAHCPERGELLLALDPYRDVVYGKHGSDVLRFPFPADELLNLSTADITHRMAEQLRPLHADPVEETVCYE